MQKMCNIQDQLQKDIYDQLEKYKTELKEIKDKTKELKTLNSENRNSDESIKKGIDFFVFVLFFFLLTLF